MVEIMQGHKGDTSLTVKWLSSNLLGVRVSISDREFFERVSYDGSSSSTKIHLPFRLEHGDVAHAYNYDYRTYNMIRYNTMTVRGNSSKGDGNIGAHGVYEDPYYTAV